MLLTRRVASFASRAPPQCCRYISTFKPDDLVILRQTNDRTAPPILSKPLSPGRTIQNHKGVIQHSDILGKEPRDIVSAVKASKNSDGTVRKRIETTYRVQPVKLEEYVRLSRRLVTPIYAADASVIVELMDIHIESSTQTQEDGSLEEPPRLEILEAGTGHGALTLYLSRAIHAANTPLWEKEAQRAKDRNNINDNNPDSTPSTPPDERKAIIHSIEVSAKYSQHAQQVVSNFRHGLYARNVDFHISDISAWLATKQNQAQTATFLSHAFLDLPNADSHIAAVSRALRTDGTLVVFNPSITQITDVARRVREEGVELELESVVELATNGGSGGREWDVRPVRPRAGRKGVERAGEEEEEGGVAAGKEEVLGESEGEEGQIAEADASGDERSDIEPASQPVAPPAKDEWSMVCRPKVGDRVIGGGFLGVWKKKRVQRTDVQQQQQQQGAADE